MVYVVASAPVFGQAVQSPFTISVPTNSVFPFSSFGEYQEELLLYSLKKKKKHGPMFCAFFLYIFSGIDFLQMS